MKSFFILWSGKGIVVQSQMQEWSISEGWFMPFSNFPYNALRRQIASICAERNWETRFQGCSVYLRGSILEEMDINSSKIEVLPDSFSALINLRKLSIGWSSLKELPTQFYDLYFPYSVTRNNITWTLDVATNARSD